MIVVLVCVGCGIGGDERAGARVILGANTVPQRGPRPLLTPNPNSCEGLHSNGDPE